MSDAPNPNPNPAGEQPWYASIGDESLRGLAELKKFESPEKVLSAYANLEKHMGVPPERLLRLPETPDAPEWAQIKARIPGFETPEDAAGYELPIPEGFNTDYAAAVAAKAKELGVPKSMLKGLAEFNNEFVKRALDAEELAQKQAYDTAMAELRVDWGGQYDTTMALSKRAEDAIKAELGVDDDTLLAWQNANPKAYHKLLAYQGSKLGEHQRVDGGQNTPIGTMSPEAAKVKIKALAEDPAWFDRWNAGDAAARKEWSDLNAIVQRAGQSA
jgi:hypothetical protein